MSCLYGGICGRNLLQTQHRAGGVSYKYGRLESQEAENTSHKHLSLPLVIDCSIGAFTLIQPQLNMRILNFTLTAYLLAFSTVHGSPITNDHAKLPGNALNDMDPHQGTGKEIYAESHIGKRQAEEKGRVICYGALQRNTVPCSRRGASYYNCRPGAQANPYTRGCSTITRCRSMFAEMTQCAANEKLVWVNDQTSAESPI